VHKEFVPPGPTVNQFYLELLKRSHDSLRKIDQKCGAAVIGSFATTMPLPARSCVCSSFWQKTTWLLFLILHIHPTLRLASFSCSLIRNARWNGMFCWRQL